MGRKPRFKKTQPQKNKDAGKEFEATMFQFFTNFLRSIHVEGIAYMYPESNYDQIIDIILDSLDIGYCAIECKSIKTTINNSKIYFSKITNVSKRNGLNQFVNQHRFLKSSSRYGLMCFEFRDVNKIIIVPHQYVYDKLISGSKFITVEEIISIGFDIDDKGASLKSFIRNNCKTLGN